MKEVLFTDPANGQMRAVRISKLISAGFLYKKDSLVNLKRVRKRSIMNCSPMRGPTLTSLPFHARWHAGSDSVVHGSAHWRWKAVGI
jgi:hypothetical protein